MNIQDIGIPDSQEIRDSYVNLDQRKHVTHGLRSISRTNWVFLVLIGLLLSSIFSINNGQGAFYYVACALAVATALSVCVIPLRLIAFPFATLVLLMPDLTQTSEQILAIGRTTSASLWQLPIGPISPAILVLVCLAVALLRFSLISTVRPYKMVFIYFFVISMSISLLHGYPQESIMRFIVDFKLVIVLYVSLLLFDAYFRTYPEETLRVTQIFFAFLVGSLLHQVIHYLVTPASSDVSGTYIHSSLDSGKGLVLAISFFALSKIGKGNRIFVWTLVACFTIYWLISYQTRWLIVTFALGLLIIYATYPVKRKILLAACVVPAFAIGAVILIALESEALRIMILRFSFIQDIGLDSSFVKSEVVRGSSIINSLNLLWEKNSVFTGMGYGSYFNDDYFPMPDVNISAFDAQSLQSGKFYRVHDFVFHFLFKFGLVGLAIYLWLFIKPLRQFWKNKRGIMQRQGGAELLIVLLGIAPTVITYMWFTGKGNIFCGFYIALCTSWLVHISKNDSESEFVNASYC